MDTESDGVAGGAFPRHVAFIMDGNGRWAEERKLSRAEGHRAGAETVRRVVAHARRRRLPYLTLYAFSTENWSRPQAEVEALMELLGLFIEAELPTMLDNGVALRIIGDTAALPDALRESLRRAEAATAGGAGLALSLAINYGGRDEIVRAARCAAEQLSRDGRDPASMDEEYFASFLDTAGMPSPDLIIRTSGEMRLSNFLVWQAAYSELYFTERRWPEFCEADFDQALEAFGRRIRKFGGG